MIPRRPRRPGRGLGRRPSTAARLDLADPRARSSCVNVWGSWCTAVPRRGSRCWSTPRASSPAEDVAFVGIDIRDPSKATAQAFVRSFECPTRRIYDPGSESCCAFRGTARARRAIPSTVVLDREGRVAASVLGAVPSKPRCYDLVDDVADGGGGRRWLTGSRETALSGSLLLAVPVAVVAGLVSFFSPCVVPLLPGYLSYATGLSGADLADRQRRPRPDARRHRRCSCSASRFVFVGARRAVRRASGALALRQPADAHDRARASSRSCSGWPSWGWSPLAASATSGSTGSRRSAWPRRRCSASCSASAGRRASARPSR